MPFLHTRTIFFIFFGGGVGGATNPYKSYQGCVRKRGHTWRRFVLSFGPFLDFLTSDNVRGLAGGADTGRLPVRDTQSIATFTIVFLEPLKSDKVLIKAKSTEVRLLGSCDAFQCTKRAPSIDKLAFHQEFYSFVYLFFLNCP